MGLRQLGRCGLMAALVLLAVRFEFARSPHAPWRTPRRTRIWQASAPWSIDTTT